MSAGMDKGEYDAIVIGTGPGGGTIGFALARHGLKVLFIEKGISYEASPDAITGDYAEMFYTQNQAQIDTLKLAGRYSDTFLESGKEQTPMIGCSTGGSTALFGMAMERFFECDFLPRPVTELNRQSSLPKGGWPVTYQEMLGYYEEAERIYRVKGIGDPLRRGESFGYEPPPSITAANQELFEFLQKKGMSPYIMPRSCDFVKGCIECQGFICPKNCKNDSYKMCVKPAIHNHGAELITDCEVLRLTAKEQRVHSIQVKKGNAEKTLYADIFILAAGAIGTPSILLNSKNRNHPNGLANNSGEVGRNLMRHCIDLFVVKTKSKSPSEGFTKEIAFNDLYAFSDERLGTLQSFGRLPPKEMLASTLSEKISSISKPLGMLFEFVRPITEYALHHYFKGKLVLASILEDLPYRDNRVEVDSATGKPIIKFKLYPYEKDRIHAFRKKARAILKGIPYLLVKQAESNKRLAHVCGTCRMGNDPKSSVVNRDCRAHDITNLYIADASVLPTSGGTNPALTVAANALRVADAIMKERQSRMVGTT